MIEKCKTFRRISVTLLGVFILTIFATAGFALAAPAQQDVVVTDNEDGDWVDWFAVAAQTIGIDDDTLFGELLNDKSIADVAREKGVDPQKVIDALIAAETEWLTKQIAEGNLSQEEADEWLKTLPQDVKEFVEETGLLEIDCEESECDWVDWFAVAAQTIGIDGDTLFGELLNDKSIADVARENGIDPQKVIDALIAAETEWLTKQVAEGNLSQEEADEWLKTLPQDVKEFVEETGLLEIDCEESECDWVDWFAVAAQTIGIDGDTLFGELLNDKSIADVARENGIDPQKVIDALIAAETEWLTKQVAEGNLSQEEADEWLKTLPQDVKEFVEMTMTEEMEDN